jgi:hypothetical protein
MIHLITKDEFTAKTGHEPLRGTSTYKHLEDASYGAIFHENEMFYISGDMNSILRVSIAVIGGMRIDLKKFKTLTNRKQILEAI